MLTDYWIRASLRESVVRSITENQLSKCINKNLEYQKIIQKKKRKHSDETKKNLNDRHA